VKASEVREMLARDRAEGRDPANRVLHLVADWMPEGNVAEYHGDGIVAALWGSTLAVSVGGNLFSFAAKPGPALVKDPATMAMEHWGLERLGPGVWAVQPSVVVPGAIHAYIVLRGVPEPAPFGDPPAAPPELAPQDRCLVCGLAGGELRRVGTNQQTGEPAFGHELCGARMVARQAQEQLGQSNQVLATLVGKLGGSVTLHEKDFERAAAVGFQFDVRDEPPFLHLDLKRIAPASPLIVPGRLQ
jgi:hypothetical protein